ncbi:MAG: prepilin-type N-terminal cleavage/methylation domain-containing protein [Thermus sp.]|nr:prepilin-type N-terminal cleavage/methylation domain-containing protein [Thermus sp.]
MRKAEQQVISYALGFTIFELLLALAILGVVLALAYGGVVQFLQVRTDLDAQINGQAKLRRVVEVLTQDLRGAVLGGLAPSPYPAGSQSISFALMDGGAGFPVMPHDSGNNTSFPQASEVRILAMGGTPGIANDDWALMVNGAGDGVLFRVTQVNAVGQNLWHVVHAGCGNTITYTPNTILLRVRTLGLRYDPKDRLLLYRENAANPIPMAFNLTRFRIDYVYEAASGVVLTNPDGYNYQNPTGTPPFQIQNGNQTYTLRRLALTLSTSFPARGREVERTYTSLVELPALTQLQAQRIQACQ